MTDAVAEKDREISVRDEKLSRLKHQMADALKGNSWFVSRTSTPETL